MLRNKIEAITFLLFIFLVISGCSSGEMRENAKDKADALLVKIAEGTATDEFNKKYFPREQMEPILFNLKNNCDFANRRGNFINDFYKNNVGGVDQVFFLYEFYLKCDTLRFTLGYNLGDKVELFKLGIHPVEEDNPMIINEENRLRY